MKIEKVQLLNFQGLDGKRALKFPDKIDAMILPNGSGKTSLLNAIRYALTGAKPDGTLISRGTDVAAVNLVLSDGNQIGRKETENGGSAFFNGNKCSAKFLSEQMEILTGVDTNTLKIVTASDVLAGMKPQQFSEFLLSYIPKKLTADDLVAAIEGIDEWDEKCIRAYFKDDTFPVSRLDEFYKAVFDKRKEYKTRYTQNDSLLKSFQMQGQQMLPKEELQKKAEALKAEYDKIISYEEAKRAYTALLQQYTRQKEQLADLDRRISENKAAAEDPEARKRLEKSIQDADRELQNLKEVYLTLKATVSTLEKALESLNTQKCPLSDKLVCTTDKTAVREEIEKAISENKAAADRQMETGNRIATRMKEDKTALDEMNRNFLLLREKTMLTEQRDALEKNLTKVPDEPKMPENAGQVKKDYEDAVKALGMFENAEKIKKIEESQAGIKRNWDSMERLVKYFAPKGIVKETINAQFMEIFDEQCNEKANELQAGMNFRFVSDNGVQVTVDVKGTGDYLPFGSLSGGEQMYVVYILLDMINALCGCRILILDELSILDEESFRAFIRIVKEHADEYDQILLSMAEHSGLRKILEEEGISEILL